ncbi:MAG: hypothetical protein CEN89_462 [Candidatus Berkelbacteria bacterium Licking1014_7]|uniref:Uncharacterized protein n=1 Tax=Candidatus Berkelbacteria bacterium Licking1014_7 TaxID=2017147 RepID=A0A554LIS2_9BACT|nr:MAG: hypothetical protein CEN89_462 [Candidatus Berkelbacteria bacterium Licking1014_7]
MSIASVRHILFGARRWTKSQKFAKVKMFDNQHIDKAIKQKHIEMKQAETKQAATAI